VSFKIFVASGLRYKESLCLLTCLLTGDPALLWSTAMNSLEPLVDRFLVKVKATEIRMRQKIVVK